MRPPPDAPGCLLDADVDDAGWGFCPVAHDGRPRKRPPVGAVLAVLRVSRPTAFSGDLPYVRDVTLVGDRSDGLPGDFAVAAAGAERLVAAAAGTDVFRSLGGSGRDRLAVGGLGRMLRMRVMSGELTSVASLSEPVVVLERSDREPRR